jgi:hypothetical protein
MCFIEFFFEICYTKFIKTEATSPINCVMRFVGLFLFSGEMGMRDFLVIYLPGSSEGIQLPTPASCGYQLIDLSSDKSGRNPLTGEQYKDIIAQKRKLTPRWDILPADLVHLLASAMKSRNTTVDLEYYDLADGQRERRTFTTGDFTCDYLAGWSDKKKFVGEISCDFIEK